MAAKGTITTSDYLPIEEFYRLVECLRKDKQYVWELLCCISIMTALRISDILHLKWCDILLWSSILVKEKKTGKTRKIAFNAANHARIKELYKLLDEPDINSFIISTSDKETSYSRQYINRKLKEFKVIYKLKISKFSTHTFRKTFGRNLYNTMENKTEALVLLMDVFKHSSVDTTKRYIGLNDEDVRQAYNHINFNHAIKISRK